MWQPASPPRTSRHTAWWPHVLLAPCPLHLQNSPPRWATYVLLPPLRIATVPRSDIVPSWTLPLVMMICDDELDVDGDAGHHDAHGCHGCHGCHSTPLSTSRSSSSLMVPGARAAPHAPKRVEELSSHGSLVNGCEIMVPSGGCSLILAHTIECLPIITVCNDG